MKRQAKQPDRTYLVMDKCYLQAATQDEFYNLYNNYHILMPEALFMELLTTDDDNVRARCFNKFPQIENPVEIIPNVGALIRYEIENKVPCTPIQDRRECDRFTFNPRIRNKSFQFNGEQATAIDEWNLQIANDAKFFKEKAKDLENWFPSLSGFIPGQPENPILLAMQEVARNQDKVREIYGQIRSQTMPESDKVNEQWALFRRVQVHLLYALEYRRRYGNTTAKAKSVYIEHDVCDAQYCITGVLAGALATRDNQIRKFFTLLSPHGLLLE